MKYYIIIIILLIFQCNHNCKKAESNTSNNPSSNSSESSTIETESISTSSASEKVTIEGVVRLVGNEPFSYLIISTDDKKSYRLPAKKKSEFIQYQTKRVRVTGLVENQLLESADHKYKFDIKTINPSLIEIISSGMQ
jgi:hypothetical protein